MNASEKREPVIITEPEYDKGKSVFGRYAHWVRWVVCQEKEAIVAQRIVEEEARIVVIGVAPYQTELYSTLAHNARDGYALIARLGVGYDGIDLQQCRDNRIYLTITPRALAQSVAEHTMALLLSLVRHIPALDARVREGGFEALTGHDLCGKTIGLAGFGEIGRKVALIASAGFGMNVMVFDEIPLDEQCRREGIAENSLRHRYGLKGYFTDFLSFASQIDFLSIHLSLSSRTSGFFDEHRLAQLKNGALLINTSRGALVDESALYDALSSGQLRAAALDVYANEPYRAMDPERDLRRLPNVVLTPHVASNTVEGNQRMAERVVQNICSFLEERYDELDRVP